MKTKATQAVGKRKTSIARLFVRDGEGKILVNGKDYEAYFGRATSRMIVRRPLELLKLMGKYDIVVTVTGGGPSGQAGAVKHALSRALIKIDPTHRPVLKKAGFLTRDDREVERKKYGHHKARKRPQYSKR